VDARPGAAHRADGAAALAAELANLPRPDGFDNRTMLKGAYVIAETKDPTIIVIVIATGSEVEVAVGAKKILDADGERVRAVSAPCWSLFERQDAAYRDSVLPRGTRRVAIEIGVTEPWRGVVGLDGLVIGLDRFGASALDKVLAKELGFTPEAVAAKIKAAKA
jgi:transketolase